jgi:hypothetical protein
MAVLNACIANSTFSTAMSVKGLFRLGSFCCAFVWSTKMLFVIIADVMDPEDVGM